MSLDDLHEPFSAVRLIVDKIGFQQLLNKYKCDAHVKHARQASGDHVLDDAHAFLAAFAVSRNHFLWIGVPDENWAARKVLRDYVSGELLHCEPPPGTAVPSRRSAEDDAEASGPKEDLPQED